MAELESSTAGHNASACVASTSVVNFILIIVHISCCQFVAAAYDSCIHACFYVHSADLVCLVVVTGFRSFGRRQG